MALCAPLCAWVRLDAPLCVNVPRLCRAVGRMHAWVCGGGGRALCAPRSTVFEEPIAAVNTLRVNVVHQLREQNEMQGMYVARRQGRAGGCKRALPRAQACAGKARARDVHV